MENNNNTVIKSQSNTVIPTPSNAPHVPETQPAVAPAITLGPTEPVSNKRQAKFIIGLVILILVVGVLTYSLFNFMNKGGESSTLWNSGDTDSSLFTSQRYNSGDVYLGSCFESAVPNRFEIISIGVLPRIGVVKPIGPKFDDVYHPYIDVRFHDNQNDLGEELLTKKYYPGIKPWIESLVQGTNHKVSFEKVKLHDRISNAIIIEYDRHGNEPIIGYDGKTVQDLSAINVFVMGKNPKIIENLKLQYDPAYKERDVKMFKEYLKTFKPTCYAESENF